VFSIWEGGSIPPAGTIDLKDLNSIFTPSRSRRAAVVSKIAPKIDAD
jgi:hypothetical protein